MHGKTLEYGTQVVGLFGTPVSYGEPLEYGTKPHPVSIKGREVLQYWVEKKLGFTGSEAKGVAFCIARAISKRGTPAAHMFEKGFEDNEAKIMEILDKIPDDIIRRVSK
jgi:hypothetical protein